ncbi:MAG: arsenate reductase family protein [Alphaproteobacteria bacterium]|nr:arsenate reductase family protein [Alphaproteobacteria bacterium]MBQ8630348.1 arsenate reductase family protein [Alphaproteobacteria bacterium]
MSEFLFIEYPKCSTCQKARKWLEDNHISFVSRHIVENNPDKDELRQWIARSGKPAAKFFNTSGLKYKALNLKNRLPALSEDEQIDLLASDGMLIKRPLLIGKQIVLSGFRPAEWEKLKA